MPKCSATIQLAALHLDPTGAIPLYQQLYEGLRQAIVSGQLGPGCRLPSSRDLSADLKVSRNTVTAAFEQLLAEGYIEGKVGAGTYVTEGLFDRFVPVTSLSPSLPPKSFTSPLSIRGQQIASMQGGVWGSRDERPRPFCSGLPALDMFPGEVWGQLVARYWRYPQQELLSYGDPCGYLPLRKVIADYLRLSRAMHCDASQVIIVSGAQQALDIAARLLLDPEEAAWIEDPSYLGAKSALISAGARLVPVPVDQDGLNVQEGISRNPTAKLVYVSPSHQFPLGVTMSLSRRLALLEWANATGSWILEDDYDSEYRYTGPPLAALHGLDTHNRVIYIGTFSKVLFPSLRLGYLVVPPDLVDAFATAKAMLDCHSPLLDQAVIADFIAEGHFARHIRRMRIIYAERQKVLLEATHPFRELIEIDPSDTGMHLVGRLPYSMDDRKVSQQLENAGVTAAPLSRYRQEQKFKQGGLVLGYTCIDADQIRLGVASLRTVLENLSQETYGNISFLKPDLPLLSSL